MDTHKRPGTLPFNGFLMYADIPQGVSMDIAHEAFKESYLGKPYLLLRIKFEDDPEIAKALIKTLELVLKEVKAFYE